MRRIEFAGPEAVRWVPSALTGAGVLVIAGSSGRIEEARTQAFAESGVLAESLRWFGGPGQHSGPWDVALEIFLERIDALRRECDRVWMVGSSFGSEAALLCGAHSDALAGVAAISPSHVVWAGYDGGRETSHWTLNGRTLPYVPFDWTGYVRETPARYRPMYERSLAADVGVTADATIPVERIGKVILVAGGDDQVWPSAVSAERIRDRRSAHGLATTIIASPDAGHRPLFPGETTPAGRPMLRGGTDAADRVLGARAWHAMLTDMRHTP